MAKAKSPTQDTPEVEVDVVTEPVVAPEVVVEDVLEAAPEPEVVQPEAPSEDVVEAPVAEAPGKSVRAQVLVGMLRANGRFHAKGDHVELPAHVAARMAAKNQVRY